MPGSKGSRGIKGYKGQKGVKGDDSPGRSSINSVHFLLFMQYPTRQFWDSGGVKLESLCNFSIVGCQWTVNCLLGYVCCV